MSSNTWPVASPGKVTLICSTDPTLELVTLMSIGDKFLITLNEPVAFDSRYHLFP